MKSITYTVTIVGGGGGGTGSITMQPNDSEYLVLTERGDGRLPLFEWKIAKTNDAVLNALIDEAVLQFNISTTQSGAGDGGGLNLTLEGCIVEYLVEDEKVGSLVVRGTLNIPEYVTQSDSAMYHCNSTDCIKQLPSLSGLTVIQDNLKREFDDTMTWIQAGRTDKAFALDVQLHSKVSDQRSLIYGITWQKELVFCSTPHGDASPKYTFVHDDAAGGGGNVVQVGMGKRTYSGVRNSLGTIMELNWYDIDTSQYGDEEKDMSHEQMLTEYPDSKDYIKIDHQRLNPSLDPNIYQNFQKSWKTNLNRLMSLQRFRVTCKSRDIQVWYDIKLFDIVHLITNSPAHWNEPSTHSGLYMLGEKRLTLSKHAAEIYYDIYRESPVKD